MRQINKVQLLSMQANSVKVANRYKRYAEYLETPEDRERLTYHNSTHMLGVLATVLTLCKISGTTASPALMLAAAAHDLGHLGRPDEYRDVDGMGNIDHAVRMLESAVMKFGLPSGTSDENLQDAIVLIRATEFPHVNLNGCDPRLEQSIRILRDADILWGLFPENRMQTFAGLFLERLRNTLMAELSEADKSIEVALTRQIKFIQNYIPHTPEARQLKRVLEEESAVAWAAMALEFMRQQELHKLITQRQEMIANLKDLQAQAEKSVDKFIAGRSQEESKEETAQGV